MQAVSTLVDDVQKLVVQEVALARSKSKQLLFSLKWAIFFAALAIVFVGVAAMLLASSIAFCIWYYASDGHTFALLTAASVVTFLALGVASFRVALKKVGLSNL